MKATTRATMLKITIIISILMLLCITVFTVAKAWQFIGMVRVSGGSLIDAYTFQDGSTITFALSENKRSFIFTTIDKDGQAYTAEAPLPYPDPKTFIVSICGTYVHVFAGWDNEVYRLTFDLPISVPCDTRTHYIPLILKGATP
jgi:hypothetical protein